MPIFFSIVNLYKTSVSTRVCVEFKRIYSLFTDLSVYLKKKNPSIPKRKERQKNKPTRAQTTLQMKQESSDPAVELTSRNLCIFRPAWT